jgi:hypothetical protein
MARVPIPSDDNKVEKASRRLECNGFSFLFRIDVIPQEGDGDEQDPSDTDRNYALLEFHNLVPGPYKVNGRMLDNYSREERKAQASGGLRVRDPKGSASDRAVPRPGPTGLMMSHNMTDVLAVAEKVVILKNGIKIGECLTPGLTSEQLATMVMTGNLGERNII